jgi:hypothetical protein
MNHSRVVRAQAKQETLRVELEARREAAEEADI